MVLCTHGGGGDLPTAVATTTSSASVTAVKASFSSLRGRPRSAVNDCVSLAEQPAITNNIKVIIRYKFRFITEFPLGDQVAWLTPISNHFNSTKPTTSLPLHLFHF
jgi:hypothetical protein